jgi:hypothetical protein
MSLSARTIVTAILALLVTCPPASSSEARHGSVRGAVHDSSGAVLPGVNVVATSDAGEVVATAVTDEAGAYVLNALPEGPVRLTFQLEGFSSAVVGVPVQAGRESVVEERLELAPLTETVMVYGRAPADSPPAPLVPPAPEVIPLPVHDRESICGPAKRGATSDSFGTIRSHRYEGERELYVKDDQLVIDGGTLNGLEVGQNVVVRRFYRVNGAGSDATGEHTAGVLQIQDADERVSKAVVVNACDELMKGDFLASFNPEPVRAPDPVGMPEFEDAARILFADAGQMMGVPRRMMVIDRGTEAGIRVGQRLTLFRRQPRSARPPAVIGDAVVVAIRTNSATIRVERASDAVAFGDWAAPQR